MPQHRPALLVLEDGSVWPGTGFGVPGMTGVETRALVRHIREKGAMRAALSTVDPDRDRLLELARTTWDMSGLDLASEVTCAAAYEWTDAAGWCPLTCRVNFAMPTSPTGVERGVSSARVPQGGGRTQGAPGWGARDCILVRAGSGLVHYRLIH